MVCYCGKETSNKKFCSRSCSNSFNNRIVPKRKAKQWFCQSCNGPTIAQRKFCKECFDPRIDPETLLGTIRGKASYQLHARIRQIARNVYRKSGQSRKCAICEYDKHIEVCHIKAIKSFTDEQTIGSVNQIDNLIALCRNHHWEQENGFLKLVP